MFYPFAEFYILRQIIKLIFLLKRVQPIPNIKIISITLLGMRSAVYEYFDKTFVFNQVNVRFCDLAVEGSNFDSCKLHWITN